MVTLNILSAKIYNEKLEEKLYVFTKLTKTYRYDFTDFICRPENIDFKYSEVPAYRLHVKTEEINRLEEMYLNRTSPKDNRGKDLIDVLHILKTREIEIIPAPNREYLRDTPTYEQLDLDNFERDLTKESIANMKYLETSTDKPTVSVPFYIHGFTSTDEGFKVSVKRISAYNLIGNQGNVLVSNLKCRVSQENQQELLNELDNILYIDEEGSNLTADQEYIYIPLNNIVKSKNTLKEIFQEHVLLNDLNMLNNLRLVNRGVYSALDKLKVELLRRRVPIPYELDIYKSEKYKVQDKNYIKPYRITFTSNYLETPPSFNKMLEKYFKEDSSFYSVIEKSLAKKVTTTDKIDIKEFISRGMTVPEVVAVKTYSDLIIGEEDLIDKYNNAVNERNKINELIDQIKYRLLHLKLTIIQNISQAQATLSDKNMYDMTLLDKKTFIIDLEGNEEHYLKITLNGFE